MGPRAPGGVSPGRRGPGRRGVRRRLVPVAPPRSAPGQHAPAPGQHPRAPGQHPRAAPPGSGDRAAPPAAPPHPGRHPRTPGSATRAPVVARVGARAAHGGRRVGSRAAHRCAAPGASRAPGPGLWGAEPRTGARPAVPRRRVIYRRLLARPLGQTAIQDAVSPQHPFAPDRGGAKGDISPGFGRRGAVGRRVIGPRRRVGAPEPLRLPRGVGRAMRRMRAHGRRRRSHIPARPRGHAHAPPARARRRALEYAPPARPRRRALERPHPRERASTPAVA